MSIPRHERTTISGIDDGARATQSIAGRVTAIRRMSKAIFFDVRDDSGKIQVAILPDEVTGELSLVPPGIGDIVTVAGQVTVTRSGQLSIRADALRVLSPRTTALADRLRATPRSSSRSVVEKRTLDLLTDESLRDALKARSRTLSALRACLDSHDFLEVDTPVLAPDRFVGSATPFAVASKTLKRDLYLRGTLENDLKQLVVGGFEKVYEIGNCFRNESPSLIEFTMLEATWAYGTSARMLELVQNLVAAVCGALPSGPVDEGARSALADRWAITTFWSAVESQLGFDARDTSWERLGEAARSFGYRLPVHPSSQELEAAKFGQYVIKQFVSPALDKPTFVGRFPSILSPLATDFDDGSREADRGYMFFRGYRVCEVVTEISDADMQRKKFELQDALGVGDDTSNVNDRLLEALEYGCPPMAGLGFNINRFLAVLLDRPRTSDVLSFPLTSEPHPL